MQLDITKLGQNMADELEFHERVEFPPSYFENQDMKDLKNVNIDIVVKLDEERDVEITGQVKGTMILEDSISLDRVEYPFSLEIDEKVEKNEENFENTLDILDILWQNIVLEVPLRFTKVKDYSKFEGEGWKLLSEEDVKTSNNPFEDLKSMFGKE